MPRPVTFRKAPFPHTNQPRHTGSKPKAQAIVQAEGLCHWILSEPGALVIFTAKGDSQCSVLSPFRKTGGWGGRDSNTWAKIYVLSRGLTKQTSSEILTLTNEATLTLHLYYPKPVIGLYNFLQSRTPFSLKKQHSSTKGYWHLSPLLMVLFQRVRI